MSRVTTPILVLLAQAIPAHAQYAEPPPVRYAEPPPVRHAEPAPVRDAEPPPERMWGQPDAQVASTPQDSWVRAGTGPVARLSEDPIVGATVALDVGRGSTGGRFAAAWMAIGSESGLAQYTGELWVDFAPRFGRFTALHPLLGAGGGLARQAGLRAGDESELVSLGIGTARAALSCQLPLAGADARTSIDATLAIPIASDGTAPPDPWALVSFSVAVGF